MGLFGSDGELVPELDERLAPLGNSLVIIDRAQLAPAWRGLGGVGKLLMGQLLPWICSDARAVALHPFPIDLGKEQGKDNATFTTALDKVKRTWGSIGFAPFTEDVWIMDPARVDHDNAMKELRKKLLL
jgi:hypothetical protein